MPTPLTLRHVFHSLTVAAALALPAFAMAETLYNQPYAESAEGGYWASTVEGKRHFDSFVLGSDARIESVSWNGMGIEEAFGLPPGHPASFTIGFYADAGTGMPGTLLSTSTIGGSGNPTDTGLDFAGVISIFSYSGTLATPFQVTAGSTYWIEIIDPTSYASWFWATGSGGDGVHSAIAEGQSLPAIENDMAFALHGTITAVPEPASAVLLILGVAGLLAARTRRR